MRKRDAAVALLTDDAEPEVDDSELPDDASQFLEATEFDREHVVMVQYQSTSGGRNLQLTGLERDGTRQLVRLGAPYWGALQAETRRLVLVRIPTPERGPPASAVARIVVEDYVDVRITPEGADIDRPE